jgi:hypothetical protein
MATTQEDIQVDIKLDALQQDPYNGQPNPNGLTTAQFYYETSKEKSAEVKKYVTKKLLEYRLFNVSLA